MYEIQVGSGCGISVTTTRIEFMADTKRYGLGNQLGQLCFSVVIFSGFFFFFVCDLFLIFMCYLFI